MIKWRGIEMVQGSLLEKLSGATATLWGAWIIVFNSFDSSPIFKVLDSITNESIWGTLFIILGMAQIVLSFTRWNRSRQHLDVFMIFIWGWLAMLYFLGNYRSTGFIPYCALALSCGLAYLGTLRHDN